MLKLEKGNVIKGKYIIKMAITIGGEIRPEQDGRNVFVPKEDAIINNHTFTVTNVYKNGVVELLSNSTEGKWLCYTTLKDIEHDGENILLFGRRKVDL